ncbi:hypothetical protein [Sphingopyxis granuli]|uniref:hypothetical protein n=1 Tax=Sphingopyxis granuli TaxID=267128 RepID=UPI001B308363|nr:hypothetical protein [Sphingopyxis granuli]
MRPDIWERISALLPTIGLAAFAGFRVQPCHEGVDLPQLYFGAPSRREIGQANLDGLTQRENIIIDLGHAFSIRLEIT